MLGQTVHEYNHTYTHTLNHIHAHLNTNTHTFQKRAKASQELPMGDPVRPGGPGDAHTLQHARAPQLLGDQGDVECTGGLELK